MKLVRTITLILAKMPGSDGDCDKSAIFHTHSIKRRKPSKAIAKNRLLNYFLNYLKRIHVRW